MSHGEARTVGNHVNKLRRPGTPAAMALLALAALGVVGIGGGSAGAAVDPADLSLTKSDSPDPVAENATLTYTVEVQNAGPDPATNVTVTDNLDSQVTPGSATATVGTCDTQGKKVTCELGTLANGASATITIQVTPKKTGQITNTASVTSDVTDPVATNNEDTEATTVSATAGCGKKPATITGTDAAETLTGTNGGDVILALGGDDQVNSGGGKDIVCAGSGNDGVTGGSGNDTVKGQSGLDTAKGQSGGDTVRGGGDNDKLRGNGGNDLLAGGGGNDSCKGGRGKDLLRSC